MMINNDMYVGDPALGRDERADRGCRADDMEQGDQDFIGSPLHCHAPLTPYPGTDRIVFT